MQNQDENVEEVVSAVLDANNSWRGLILNASLNGGTEESIFEALLSSNKITSLYIPPYSVKEEVSSMLGKAIPGLPNLRRVDIALALNEREAESMFTILRTCPTLTEITACLGHCTDGIAKPLSKYLRESVTLRNLGLDFGTLDLPWQTAVSHTGFASICDGIGRCSSLRALCVSQPPFNDEEANDIDARSLALAMAKSKSLIGAGVKLTSQSFIEKVRGFLVRTPTVQNFDVCIRKGRKGYTVALELCREWKPLLTKNITPALWPLILAKANTWHQRLSYRLLRVSHSELDALFLLVREKNDALLQNVRRKIRKRKRTKFYS
jgi:hypothetical protein